MLNIRNRSGLAIPAVIIVMAVGIILGTALWRYGTTEALQVARTEKAVQAHFLARSGAEATAEYLLRNPDRVKEYLGRDSQLTQLGDGHFVVSVYGDPDEVIIESTGTVAGISDTVAVTLNRPDDLALYGTVIEGAGGAAEIYGTAFISDLDNLGADPSIFKGDLQEQPAEFEDYEEPDEEDLQSIDPITGSTDLEIPQGDYIGYHTDYIDIGGNSKVTIDLGDDPDEGMTLLTGSFTARGNAEIRLEGKGVLKLYVQGDFDGGGTFTSSSDWDDSFVVVFVNEGTTFELTGTPEFHGIIYGPGANIRLGGNVVYHGMVIAETIDILGDITMHGQFEDLDDLDINFYIVGLWYR